MRRATRLVGLTAVLLLVVLITVEPAGRTGLGVLPTLPSFKGLNYGVPLGPSGTWVGTAWLRADQWSGVRPVMAADLDFVNRQHLGRVIRLFIALDQLIDWQPSTRSFRFRQEELANLNNALDLFDARQIRVVGVLFDQEALGSPGNFHYRALDGHHPEMRTGYLLAVGQFLRRLSSRPTIVAWDLFNEAYGSLGMSGRLPPPPAPDPVSPGYSDVVVHQFLKDLYGVAKRASPGTPLTVSDATLYWQPQPDLSRYDDILDFYDVHVYDDHPHLGDLRHRLNKPFIIGEAGAGVPGKHFADQAIEAAAVHSLLEQGLGAGAGAVLLHSIATQNIFPAARNRLTPAGQVLANFDDGRAATRPSVWPIVLSAQSLVLFVTIDPVILATRGERGELGKNAGGQLLWERPSSLRWLRSP